MIYLFLFIGIEFALVMVAYGAAGLREERYEQWKKEQKKTSNTL